MKVYHGLSEFIKSGNAVVTTGIFDGVHIGHKKILARLNEAAREMGGESVVITYWPHPRLVLNPSSVKDLRLLSTLDEKVKLLDFNEVDHLVIIPFTREFSELSSEEYIRQILIDKIGTKKLVIGYDHRFGKNREGSFEYLKANSGKYGFAVEEISRQDIDAVAVSSSKIRTALLEGEIDTATECLGRFYSFEGKVIAGEKIGRQLGYPTANISIENELKLIPADGIYACLVKTNGIDKKGMLYIGNRPTLDISGKSIEVNIFEFNADIYGEKIEISLVKKIRDDAKFANLDELKVQLFKDETASKNILARY